MDSTEQDDIRAELQRFYDCSHELMGSYAGEVRMQELQRRLFAPTNPALAARIGNTVRIDNVFGDIPPAPPPPPEPGPTDEWSWTLGEIDLSELKQS
jgi:hypothetical protein